MSARERQQRQRGREEKMKEEVRAGRAIRVTYEERTKK